MGHSPLAQVSAWLETTRLGSAAWSSPVVTNKSFVITSSCQLTSAINSKLPESLVLAAHETSCCLHMLLWEMQVKCRPALKHNWIVTELLDAQQLQQ